MEILLLSTRGGATSNTSLNSRRVVPIEMLLVILTEIGTAFKNLMHDGNFLTYYRRGVEQPGSSSGS